jgi:hypothetical protein
MTKEKENNLQAFSFKKIIGSITNMQLLQYVRGVACISKS